MPPSSSPAVDRLSQMIERISRPLEFASRDGYAHLSALRDLGAFVSTQVIQVLGEKVRSSTIEADLLALRQLFLDYNDRLSVAERRDRIDRARDVLTGLRRHVQADSLTPRMTEPEPPHPEAKPKEESGSDGTGQGTDDEPLREHLTREAASPQAPLSDVPVRFATGVGPKRAALLERLGVRTVEDALWYLPWRYEDRSCVQPIAELHPGIQATVYGTIQACDLRRSFRRRMSIVTVAVTDLSGVVAGVFFNQPYLHKTFKQGQRVMLSGLVAPNPRGWPRLVMRAPQYEILEDDGESSLHVGRIVPVYHETKGLTSRQFRVMLRKLLSQYAPSIDEPIPTAVLGRQGLPPARRAIEQVHFPAPKTDLETLNHGATPHHRRLAFEEFFLLQAALALRQRGVTVQQEGVSFAEGIGLARRLRTVLPFPLTGAQERVIGEIERDMIEPHPMNRLLQGDVGSGKTLVALYAMLMAVGAGYQAALMAPTEILAEQHYLNLQGWLQMLQMNAVLLRGGTTGKARRGLLEKIGTGEVPIAIGTHALVQRDVAFARLGLVVVDEQHKFGVLQRALLRQKGYAPDVLVMTATPIPRTLAMTVHGDLEVSVIDELPPGRKPIRTRLHSEAERSRAYRKVDGELRAGRQAYIVYPLVDESEKVDLQAAIQAAERLQRDVFPTWTVGLLHGRMKTQEKEAVMATFKKGGIHILVTTTVIEVGLDVPNATIMLIEHAERFGLAQLHQLRGRVGRGAHQSFCLLISAAAGRRSKTGRRPASDGPAGRLQALVASGDGFAIAEEDLRLRGPGEVFGVRQWGLPEFRVASLLRDARLLEQARREAFAIVEEDPDLSHPDHQAMKAVMLRRWQEKLDLGSVG